MRYISLILLVFIFSCNNGGEQNNSFVLKGNIKGAPDQKVVMEQLFFTNEPPEVADTAILKNGSFTLKGNSGEEGMYRIKFEKSNAAYIFINDQREIKFNGDVQAPGIESANFTGKANGLLKDFLKYIEQQRISADTHNTKIEQLKTTNNNDSAIAAESRSLNNSFEEFKNYLVKYVDTVSNPVVAMFALGYSQGIEESRLKPVVVKLAQRFPKHEGVINLVNEYNKVITADKPATNPDASSQGPAIGSTAPDLQMNDTSGKPFSLSMLKGKYVLVDFWASWCGPCRRENPNVVKAYNTFKNKNFTVLGVSLDKEKADWVKAIKDDGLSWKHISDLQYWNSAAVPLYGFDGIPFNVLIDPAGKIIAKDLREDALHSTLSKMLR